jgi:hypothetical protein
VSVVLFGDSEPASSRFAERCARQAAGGMRLESDR